MLVSVLFNDKRRSAIEDSLMAADFWLYPSPSWYYQSRPKPLRGNRLASGLTNASPSIFNSPCSTCFFSSLWIMLDLFIPSRAFRLRRTCHRLGLSRSVSMDFSSRQEDFSSPSSFFFELSQVLFIAASYNWPALTCYALTVNI